MTNVSVAGCGAVESSTMTPPAAVAEKADTMTEVRPAMLRKIEKAGADLAAARKQWHKATEAAAKVAVQAVEAGVSEVELARMLGVDRARTLRRWLGKPYK